MAAAGGTALLLVGATAIAMKKKKKKSSRNFEMEPSYARLGRMGSDGEDSAPGTPP